MKAGFACKIKAVSYFSCAVIFPQQKVLSYFTALSDLIIGNVRILAVVVSESISSTRKNLQKIQANFVHTLSTSVIQSIRYLNETVHLPIM